MTLARPRGEGKTPTRLPCYAGRGGGLQVTEAARGTRRKPSGDSASRQRVLDAAIECILEQGLYRASSNAIAEQAGLSSGVIQYYLRTPEGLMLAVAYA